MRNQESEVRPEAGVYEAEAEGPSDAELEDVVEGMSPGLIVRHTSRRLGELEPEEARERLISGRISFSEFVDQVGDEFRELLEFMTENDLHPGRPGEVLYCIERSAGTSGRRALRSQLSHLYAPEHRRG